MISNIFLSFLGITRRERYERAIRHELNPPIRVLELIERFPNDREVTHKSVRLFILSLSDLSFLCFLVFGEIIRCRNPKCF